MIDFETAWAVFWRLALAAVLGIAMIAGLTYVLDGGVPAETCEAMGTFHGVAVTVCYE